jgi:hypothetical protein
MSPPATAAAAGVGGLMVGARDSLEYRHRGPMNWLDWLDTLVNGASTRSAIADWLGVIGFVITLMGLGSTVLLAWRAKRAAEIAREEVHRVREELTRSSVIADLSAAIAMIEELKQQHRSVSLVAAEHRRAIWVMLLGRYTAVQHLLRGILNSNRDQLEDQHRQGIERAFLQFREVEQLAEQALLPDPVPPDPMQLNRIVAAESDTLHAILLMITQDVGST